MNDFKAYQELHKHNGIKDYAVISLLSKKFEVLKLFLNNGESEIIVPGKTNPVNKEERESKRLKVSSLGEIISNGPTIGGALKDGTLKGFDFYFNWIIDGDTTRHDFINPLSEKEKEDPEMWFKRFKILYDKASFVHIDIKDYFFKVEDKWYLIEAFKKAKELNIDIKKQFPPKIDPSEIRMLDLENIMPDLVAKPEDLDTSLVKKVGYESTFLEESKRGRAFNYSAGWWYLDIYMPGGDTLKIKRFASFRDPEMKLYKIPAEHGGRDDVLFIVQQPNEIHPEQVGGMYVIRPRNYKETPEYKTQQAKQEEEEEKRKQEQNKEAIKKRRSFLPEDD